MEIKIYSDILGASFTDKHPNRNFFQSFDAYQLFNTVDNYESLLLLAIDDNKIIGSLVALFIKEDSRVKGFLSRRCIVFGGPLVFDNNLNVIKMLLIELKSVAERKAIYTQFRNSFDLSFSNYIFTKTGYLYEEHLNVIIDLTKSEEELWSDIDSKRRNEIRRAQREGTYFKILQNEDDIGPTYEILDEVYRRAKLPFPKKSFFEFANQKLKYGTFMIFMAANDEKIIGTMYALCYQDTIYDWYAGSYQECYNKYPNDLIPWKVILWGKQNGYQKFDFGGAGRPNVPYGVRDYKKKFGGELVNYGRFEQIHKPFLFQIARLGYKLYQKLKY